MANHHHVPFTLTMSLIRLAAVACLSLGTAPQLHAKTIVTRDGVSVINEGARSVAAPYERTVIPTDDGVVVTYKFHYFNADSTAGGYRLSLPRFGDVSREGAPALLRGRDAIDCPRTATPTLKLHRVNHADVRIPIAPARPQYSDNGQPSFPETSAITPYGGFFSTEFVGGISHQKSRHESVVLTDICPFTYSMSDSTLRLCTELVYEITFNTPAVTTDISGVQDPTCPEVNPGSGVVLIPDADTPLVSKNADEEFLIITVPEYVEALQPFVKWKRIQGYRTHVATPHGKWTPQTILATVKAHYDSNHNLSYILLVGDNNAVPAMEVKYDISNIVLITDKYYGCMDGDDDELTDIVRGRWPVTSTEELSTVISHTIEYEKNPPSDEEFYTHATHLAYFEDHGLSTVTGIVGNTIKRFERTCEEVQNHLETNHNIEVDRLYSAPEDCSYDSNRYIGPQAWADQYSYHPIKLDSLPSLKGYEWNKSFSQFVDCIQNGRLYALYRGHGLQDSWWNKSFSDSIYDYNFISNHVRSLPAGLNTSVVFSITCDTGDFSSDCFANAWLTSKGGSVAVIAQSYTGISGINDLLAIEMFNYMWGGIPIDTDLHSYDFSPLPKLSRIGRLVDSTLNRLYNFSILDSTLYTTQVTHCFADPSLILHTSVPKTIDNSGVEIIRGDSTMTVNTGTFTGHISLYDDHTKQSHRFYGNSASIKCTNPENVWVHIEKEGYAPFIFEGEDAPQDSIDNENRNRICDIIDNLDGTITVHYAVEEWIGLPYLEISSILSSFRLEPGLMPVGQESITLTLPYSGYYTVVLRGTKTPEMLDQKTIVVRK